MEFISPSYGSMEINGVFEQIIAYMQEMPTIKYRLIIGTDSQTRDDTCFVTAILIHREGRGGRYFYSREKHRYISSLRQRIFYETSRSLAVASQITALLAQNGFGDLNIEIHLDVGPNGETKELIREVVGMVVGSGFDAKIKPESYGASNVADKHTK
ncbi:MAG: ribonuclease H-like YkuK family protein [Limnochordia bacterium]|jgi:predicted RNase H-related nuclease YkuK (DUF458 family)|nr:ribonuclease H-like YkuK family protein [Limnochordia bacterium]MDD2628638.1 ribonuclease H-like YkuK family protein [Limnochordia bacterium]MDD4516945.1 ribonuclease H-like YkuK family protein [Limnochordia bacterium]